MKKILIASYFFPPCNIVASQRAASFADNFHKFGLHPIVVTRHWTGEENSTAGYESENLLPPKISEKENYTLLELPFRAQLEKPHHRALMKTSAGKNLLYASLYARGTINPKCNAFDCFHDFLDDFLRANPVDFVFATGFPMNTIKLGSRLAAKFKAPFIADFRDLWDNNLLAADYKPPVNAWIQNVFYEFHLRKWLKTARLITSVTEPLVEKIARLAPHAETLVVRNGFERDLFAEKRENFKPPKNKFVFSVIGTLKPNQDLSVMLDGLRMFIEDKNLNEIELNFVGIEEFPEVRRLIENVLPRECTRVSPRIGRSKAIEKMCRSHVLFYAGWRGFRGIASGKIYEYLGATRNILIAPSDEDVLEKIISETGAGKFAETPAEVAGVLNNWFIEWKSAGKIKYAGEPEKIENYTREKQAEKLARKILQIEKSKIF